MKALACLAVALTLCGCASTVEQQKLEPVRSGERVDLVAPAVIIEKRGPLGIAVEWQLLPGAYLEKYASPSGRVFVSDGRLLQFTSSMKEKTSHVGGFIVLKDKPGVGKLYTVRENPNQPTPTMNFLAGVAGGFEGDLFLHAEFDLSILKKR